jgi:hypothetical protein
MSNIGDYQALVAALEVSFTDQFSGAIAIKAQDAKKLKNSYEAADTPVRLLLPYGGGEFLASEMVEPDESFGTNTYIDWVFSDVLLWRGVNLGEGLGDSAYDLREYAQAYMTAALSLDASSITDRMTLRNVLVQIQVLNFPEGSASWFTGAVATWQVREDDPI